MIRRLLTTTALAATLGSGAQAQTASDVLDTYADIAAAAYEDSLISARALEEAVTALIDAPSAETLQAARDVYLEARVPTCRPRSTASAIRSSTTGRAR